METLIYAVSMIIRGLTQIGIAYIFPIIFFCDTLYGHVAFINFICYMVVWGVANYHIYITHYTYRALFLMIMAYRMLYACIVCESYKVYPNILYHFKIYTIMILINQLASFITYFIYKEGDNHDIRRGGNDSNI